MGFAMMVPVLVDRVERGGLSAIGIGILAVGCGAIAGGIFAAVVGSRQPRLPMPSGVRAAVAANALALAFLALELSDRLVRQDGKIFYWTTFLLPPALLIFFGLVTARSWSWWVARGVAALGVVWFLGFLVVVPFVPLQADGVPAPWYGRVYTAGVTITFAAILFSPRSGRLAKPNHDVSLGLVERKRMLPLRGGVSACLAARRASCSWHAASVGQQLQSDQTAGKDDCRFSTPNLE
jgi:hypothetical protein